MREINALPRTERDSIYKAMRKALGEKQSADSLRAVLLAGRRVRKTQCDTSAFQVVTRRRYEGTLKIAERIPCDTSVLAKSPELPPSIYEPGEELFGTAERDELAKALGLGLQAGWGPQSPTWHTGIAEGLLRYNRVEGLSVGGWVDEQLGMGYAARVGARMAFASRQPFGDIGLTRSDGRRTLGVSLYRRIAVADDWGAPLGFGASVAALLYGRDDGSYYRATGAELTWDAGHAGASQWRLFAERQRSAPQATAWSLFGGAHDASMGPNIVATEGDVVGTTLRLRRDYGLDPDRLRAFTEVRFEGGAAKGLAPTKDFAYGRGALDLTLSRPITRRFAASLGGSAGSAVGQLPGQRLWYLGGLQTVRGQSPATMAGDAFWVGHAELGASSVSARPVLFYDVGWAGDRHSFSTPGKPMSGAGVGMSFLDGLVRFDLARGIYPRKQTRFDLYVEARF